MPDARDRRLELRLNSTELDMLDYLARVQRISRAEAIREALERRFYEAQEVEAERAERNR